MKKTVFMIICLCILALCSCGINLESQADLPDYLLVVTPNPQSEAKEPVSTSNDWDAKATPEPTETPDLLDILVEGSHGGAPTNKYSNPSEWDGWSLVTDFDMSLNFPFNSMPGTTSEAVLTQELEDFDTAIAIINNCVACFGLSSEEALYKDEVLSKSPIILAYAYQYVFNYNGYVVYVAYTEDTLYVWTDNQNIK